MVSALDFQAGYRGFKSRSGRDNFQTISAPSSYSTCPGLSIKWTRRRLVTDSGTKCAWVIHESKAVQIHVYHSKRRCLYVPRVPGSVKNPHNNKALNWTERQTVMAWAQCKLIYKFSWPRLFVLRFYGPVNPVGSCQAWSVYQTTLLLGRLSPLSS